MAEEKIINLKVNNNIDSTVNQTVSLKKQLKEAILEVQQLSEQFGETSKEAAAAAKRAAELKDKIEDANDAIQSFKGEGAFIATGKALGSVASGLSAVQGGLALVGAEGENVQETILKVQAAMALSQGLQGLEDAGRSFKQLGVVAKNALSGIRTGIAATGIGVLLLALGAVVAYWDDIKEAVSGVSDEQKELNKLSQEKFEASKKDLENISAQDNVLKLQGKSEKEILAIKIKKTDETIKEGKINIANIEATNKLEVEAAKRNNKYLQTFAKYAIEASILPIRILAAPLDLLIQTANKVSKILGFGEISALNLNEQISNLASLGAEKVASFVFDPNEVKAKGDKTVEEQKAILNKLANDRAGYVLQRRAIDKEAADKAAAKAKEEAEKAAKLRDEQRKLADKLADDNFYTELEKNKKIEAERAKHLNNLVNANLEANKKQIADDQEATAAKIALAEAERDAKIQAADATAQTLNSLAQLLGEQTVAGKAAAVASATISTFLSAQKAYESTVGIPFVGPVLAPINAGLAIATGLKSIKNILAVKVPNGGSVRSQGVSSPASGAPAESSAPQFNVVGTNGINQIAQVVGKEQPPVKAYVVSNDVTTAQSLERNIVKSASLG